MKMSSIGSNGGGILVGSVPSGAAGDLGGDEKRLVPSLPLRRQPNFNDNISEGFFQLDEEQEEESARPVSYYTDEIPDDLLDEQDESFTEAHLANDLDEEEEGTPVANSMSLRAESGIAASVPIAIANQTNRTNHCVVNGVERVIPFKKLEKKMADEELNKALSVREQTMFRNMQRFAFSVQPEDCPERLWGDNAEWEDERRRRRCSFSNKEAGADEDDHHAYHHEFQKTKPPVGIPSTAPNHPMMIHTPRQPKIVRPLSKNPIPFGDYSPPPAPAPSPIIQRPRQAITSPLAVGGRSFTVDSLPRPPRM